MIAECTYLYPDGRHCRRLPRRGESLCHDHRRLVARGPAHTATDRDEEAFNQQMREAAEEILAMPLPAKLEHLRDCLNALHGFIEAKASSEERSDYTRATMAAVAALDCALAQSQVLAETFPKLSPEIVSAVTMLLHFAGPVPPPQQSPKQSTVSAPAPQAFENRVLVDKHF